MKIMIVCQNKDCLHNKNERCSCTTIGITQDFKCDSYYPMIDALAKHLKKLSKRIKRIRNNGKKIKNKR